MNKQKLLRIFWILLLIAMIAGTLISLIQLTMAVKYGELGRVVVYFGLALFCVFFAVLSGVKLKKETR